MLNAALEGRITTTPPSRATMKSFLASNLVLLKAEPFRMPRSADFKPDFPPSYTLHVSASQGEDHRNAGGPDFRSLKGYDLKDAMQELHGVNRIRVYLPVSLDNGKRYDFAPSLSKPERPERLRDRVRQGIVDYFHITASRETHLLEAYVVTATDRQPPRSKVQSRDQVGSDSASSLKFESVGGLDDSLGNLKPVSIDRVRSVRTDGTADEFCRTLEMLLDRPVVSETNLQGEFEFDVESAAGAVNDFLERLRDQTGLLITPAQRNVEVLVYRPR